MSKLNETPAANRLHIGFFGKTNSGKSSLINALTNQSVSIVSEVAGTTTDPVSKAMEIYPLGPCLIIDTAGFLDESALGKERLLKTEDSLKKCNIAIIVSSVLDENLDEEKAWAKKIKDQGAVLIWVINKSDLDAQKAASTKATIETELNCEVVVTSCEKKTGIEDLKEALKRTMPALSQEKDLIGDLAKEGDSVVLVMPQDIQAPKGRLILPQVQTIRCLLDKGCQVTCVTTDQFVGAVEKFKNPPELIITDSQVFDFVYKNKPEGSLLTSFSVLMAAQKGDIDYYVQSAKAIEALTKDSKVLIAELCTHAPLEEDIGRVKIPRFLRKKVGEELTIDLVAGNDFPEDVSGYDLIIQCGACMVNRPHVMSRINAAKGQSVPMTNYGVTIAYLNGILDKIVY